MYDPASGLELRRPPVQASPSVRWPSRALRLTTALARATRRRLRLGSRVASFAAGLPRSSMPLLFVGLGALSSCDRDNDNSSGGTVGQPSLAVANGAAARLGPDELAALRAEVNKTLRSELRAAVVAELRQELAPAIKAELAADARRERRPDAVDSAGAGDPADPGDPSGPATPPQPGSDGLKPGDPWSELGTRIWPSAGGLKLVELVVGTALEDKLPTDVKTHYPTPPEILYCYSVFENPEADATVTHVWRRGSRLVSRVELEVGNSPKWRTWSKQRTQPHWTGLWSCEVLGGDGRQLGLTVFQIGG